MNRRREMVSPPQGDEKEYAWAAEVASTSASNACAGVAIAKMAGATAAIRGRRRKEPNARLLRSGCFHVRCALAAKLFDQSIVVGIGHGREVFDDLLDFGAVETPSGPLALDHDLIADDSEGRVGEPVAV